MNYTIIMTSDDLYHHGILGQKWGQRNGPPYPLGAEDHSAREKKAGWRKSLANKQISKIQAKARKQVEIREENTNQGKIKITDRQKKLIKIGAAVAISGLAIYGAYRVNKFSNFSIYDPKAPFKILSDADDFFIYQTEQCADQTTGLFGKMTLNPYDVTDAVREVMEEMEANAESFDLDNRKIFDKADISMLDESIIHRWNSDPLQSFYDLRRKINPSIVKDLDQYSDDIPYIGNSDYDPFEAISLDYLSVITNGEAARHMVNCQFCSASYELNRRGYDVIANGREGGSLSNIFLKMFKTKENSVVAFNNVVKKEKILTELKNAHGNLDGLRGELSFVHKDNSGGHSVVWEIIDGQLTIMDFQVGKIYSDDNVDKFLTLIKNPNFIRLDNAEVNWSEQLLSALDLTD